ncbi:MAG TPA: zinc metalloprotease [Nocardioidaceae bacterium]|nr:zinc metalloprotease [Nocardioidaceae bacterium]
MAGRPRGLDHETLTASDVRRIEEGFDRALERRGSRADRLPSAIRVPVRVNVVDGNRYRGPSKAQINGQLRTLNRGFSGRQSDESEPTNVSFFLKSFNRVKNQRWLTAGLNGKGRPDADSKEMRSRLRRGGPAALNMYFTKIGDGLLGYSSFPWTAAGNLSQDGITIHSESLKGGSFDGYNRGDTAVHEVGHWLGLYHTFQDGCSPDNDYVDDTPAEQDPAFGCPVGADTCRAREGDDPIHNFMDYSYDTCMYMFTALQSARMDEAWQAYRAP